MHQKDNQDNSITLLEHQESKSTHTDYKETVHSNKQK